MATSKKPSGLSIERNDNKFTCSWKRGATYSSQTFQYQIDDGEWTAQTCGANVAELTVTLTASDYYPTTAVKINSFSFRIKGKSSGKKASAFVEETMTLGVPNIPEITATLDSQNSNICNFAWTTDTSDSGDQWFANNAYQTMLVQNCNTENGDDLDWSSATIVTKTASGNVNITENTAQFNTYNYSYTRWVRMWSRGAKGDSGYSYANHVYAMPYQSANVKATASKTSTGGYLCNVTWETTSNIMNPTDSTIVQYTMVVPNASLACPSGATWTDANTSKDIEANDSAVFYIDDLLNDDQCLFVRVNTKHDNNVTYGTAVLADVGTLKTPTTLNVSTNATTFVATVSCTNNSDVPDSYLAVMYIPASNPSDAFVAGIIAHGQTSATVQCPDFSNETAINFEVYAVVGSNSYDTRSGGVKVYRINEQMRSASLSNGGNVPSKPTNVSVSATDVSGTIQVSWSWSWAEATGAELSWADHKDAWESTEQPETYNVPKLHQSKWNISGLETGQKWYVKVRLYSGEDNFTYTQYSDIKEIDLSSAPSKPVLVLSDSVITENGSVTASWGYVATDGTGQAYAEVCQATVTSNGITYGDIIAHTQTEQHVTINAKDAGWQTGHTYNLCVRVVSASGRVSDSWSDPVSVIVADPLTCTIPGLDCIWSALVL